MSEPAKKLQPQPTSPVTSGKGRKSSLSPSERLEKLKEMTLQHVEKSLPNYESWADAFKRLATSRVGKALQAIGLVHNLAKGSQYGHTREQENQIVEALQEAVDQVRNAFAGVKPGKKQFIMF